MFWMHLANAARRAKPHATSGYAPLLARALAHPDTRLEPAGLLDGDLRSRSGSHVLITLLLQLHHPHGGGGKFVASFAGTWCCRPGIQSPPWRMPHSPCTISDASCLTLCRCGEQEAASHRGAEQPACAHGCTHTNTNAHTSVDA